MVFDMGMVIGINQPPPILSSQSSSLSVLPLAPFKKKIGGSASNYHVNFIKL